jgi:hypothetical protein
MPESLHRSVTYAMQARFVSFSAQKQGFPSMAGEVGWELEK